MFVYCVHVFTGFFNLFHTQLFLVANLENWNARGSMCVFLSFLSHPFLHIHCRCRGLVLHLITLNDTCTHLVGILWMRDLPITETSLPDNTQHPQEIVNHALSGIQTHNPNKWVAADLCFRLHGHLDHLNMHMWTYLTWGTHHLTCQRIYIFLLCVYLEILVWFTILSWVYCATGMNEERHPYAQRRGNKSGMREFIKKEI